MITVVAPSTPEQIQALREDIEFLASFTPEVDPGFIEDIEPGRLYLFYWGDDPSVGILLDELGPKSIEIHGTSNPAHREHKVAHEATRVILNRIFSDPKRRNVIAKIDPKDKGQVGFVRRWGFQKINTDNGRAVYRLTRSSFNELWQEKKQ